MRGRLLGLVLIACEHDLAALRAVGIRVECTMKVLCGGGGELRLEFEGGRGGVYGGDDGAAADDGVHCGGIVDCVGAEESYDVVGLNALESQAGG